MEIIKKLLEDCKLVVKPEVNDVSSTLKQVQSESENFPIQFPISSVRCKSLSKTIPQEKLVENIVSTYPIIHEKVLTLFCKFLLHKREHGTDKEKNLYKDMSICQLVSRLLTKRAVVFIGVTDRYKLISGIEGSSGWEEIGTDSEKEPLLLKDCLSYDEMKLSALLYVSGQTVFINDGSRNNQGIVETNLDKIETSGVIIGLVGTRLAKKNVMEWQELIITQKQNTPNNGYRQQVNQFFRRGHDNQNRLWRNIWTELYGEPSLSYDEAKKLFNKETESYNHRKRFVFDKCFKIYFDNLKYAKHLSVPFDCAILEANHRASQKGKMAYLHIVGIGLGVWRAFNHQDTIFVKTFLERLSALIKQLNFLSDVHLSYMRVIPDDILSEDCGKFIKSEDHPLGGVKVHLSRRQPSSKLVGEHENKLLIETYAWDGNAQPGNEFWAGSLKTSGDPAAACSSQVSELHNSHINKKYVCGENLHVAGQYGVHHVSLYAHHMLNNMALS